MCWIILIVFFQTSNQRIKKLYCMCSRTMKQWSRWLLKEGVPQWDMFPRLTELHLIGCLIELIWFQNPNQVFRHQKPTRRHSNQREFHTWWVESFAEFFLISAISVLHFVLKPWQKDYNKIQEKYESQRNRDQWWALLQGCLQKYRPRPQKARWREAMEIKIRGVRKLRENRPGQPVVGNDPKTVSGYYHEHFTESSFSARYSKWEDYKAWSSQEWKADKSMDDGTGQTVVTSWGKTHESQSSFFHEKTQHDRTVQVVNEQKLHDWTEQTVVISQSEIRPHQLIIGNDETELELSVESKSFLNRVNDQVRKRQKRSSMNVTEDGENIPWYGECSCL